MVRVVGVHGVGNWFPELGAADACDRLSAVWSAALRPAVGGNVPCDVRVAYYADHLHGGVAQGDDPDALPADAQAMIQSWVAALGLAAEQAQGMATLPMRQLLSWVAMRFGLDAGLVRWFVTQFFGEVATYLRDPAAPERHRARQRVVDLVSAHRPRVVIAHSLGSVVAFEALCHRPDLDVELLVTVGSPLGMPDVIVDRLAFPDGRRVGRPPGVRRWINIADVGDLVAIPRRLGGRFDVDSDHETRIGLFDFHRVAKYLASPPVGTALCAMSAATVGRPIDAEPGAPGSRTGSPGSRTGSPGSRRLS